MPRAATRLGSKQYTLLCTVLQRASEQAPGYMTCPPRAGAHRDTADNIVRA